MHAFALLICFFLLAISPVWSQTNVAKPRWVSSRYLLIVETSRSMHRRSDGVAKTVANLLYSGMNRQIRQGDSLGVWTYNQQLYAGRLPLQRWATQEQENIFSTILDFLKKQKYENQPAFSAVRPALDKVIKDSESITVILLSSGEEPITGTPFDDQINRLYKNWHDEQQKARMPFVTVLRAKRGTITGFSVTPSPWQVEFPAWPAEPAVAKTVVPEPLPPKTQPSPVQSLIFTGKKPKPAEATNAIETATTTSPVAPSSPRDQPVKAANPSAAAAPPFPAVSQKPGAAAPPTVPERKAEKAELPRHVPNPSASKDLASSSPTPKPEAATPVVTNRTTASVPAQTPPPAASPAQEISAGIAIPAPGSLSNKIIWLAGLTVLGITCAILIVLARRPAPGHISLITRSLEQDKND